MAGSTMTQTPSPFGLRRRAERPTPFHKLRIGDAARSGREPLVAFPGIEFPASRDAGRRSAAGALAILAHAAVFGLLFAIAWLTPPPVKDEPIPIELIQLPKPPPPPPPVVKVEPPPPPPVPVPRPEAPPAPRVVENPKPVPKPPAPAPAPKALA
jgi:hypothetical protein